MPLAFICENASEISSADPETNSQPTLAVRHIVQAMQKIVFATLDESIIQKLETRLIPKIYEEIKENLGVVDNAEIMRMRKSHYQF